MVDFLISALFVAASFAVLGEANVCTITNGYTWNSTNYKYWKPKKIESRDFSMKTRTYINQHINNLDDDVCVWRFNPNEKGLRLQDASLYMDVRPKGPDCLLNTTFLYADDSNRAWEGEKCVIGFLIDGDVNNSEELHNSRGNPIYHSFIGKMTAEREVCLNISISCNKKPNPLYLVDITFTCTDNGSVLPGIPSKTITNSTTSKTTTTSRTTTIKNTATTHTTSPSSEDNTNHINTMIKASPPNKSPFLRPGFNVLIVLVVVVVAVFVLSSFLKRIFKTNKNPSIFPFIHKKQLHMFRCGFCCNPCNISCDSYQFCCTNCSTEQTGDPRGDFQMVSPSPSNRF